MNLTPLPELPLSGYRADFLHALNKGTLLLEAEPGAGKSTLAPLWTLDQTPVNQVVWLVQPRVLAARALAQRLAYLLGESVGQTVGFQVPYEKCLSAHTRLLLMTPGILLQHLLQNPSLEGVATVMLDEIHERAVNQDTAWVWLQEVQILREDLQLVLMSATPDPVLQRQISQRLFAAGRCFPVTTQFQPPKQSTNQVTEKIEQQLLRALASYSDWQRATGLVFLPGWRDIEACAQLLQQHFPSQKILRLHSRVPANEQAKALDPAQGPRLILATNIAETSLTIADVTLVVDSGLVRRAEYEQRTGISRLRTARISQASADQRRGRAGRVQAGHCIRLWSQDQPLAAADLPEIRTTDYLPLALRLAHWGSRADELNWLEAPNNLAMEQAQQQLQRWNLLSSEGRITPAGTQVSQLGTHPRIAVLLQSAGESQQWKITSDVLLLALSLHFELEPNGDLYTWLDDAVRELQRNIQWRQQRQRWLSALNAVEVDNAATSDKTNASAKGIDAHHLALAFSDRIGYRQESGRYRLNSGISVEPMHRLESQWAVFVELQPRAKGHAGVGVSLSLSADQQRKLSHLQTTLVFKNNLWQRQSRWLMGGVVIAEQTAAVPAKDIAAELIELIRAEIAGKSLVNFIGDTDAQALLQRARLVAQQGIDMPALDDVNLVVKLDQWLQPFVNEKTRLDNLPWLPGLEFFLGYEANQKIHAMFPQKISLPSGRAVSIEFSADGMPQISAKLQEFFGCKQLQLGGGKIPLRIHLLSPNGSPLAITTDLRSFWHQAYPEVRREMRGRYPRHPWPENPLEHVATALTKKRLANNPLL